MTYSGLSGQIEFNGARERSNVNIDVMALYSDELRKVGTFKLTNKDRLSFLPPITVDLSDEDLPIKQQTFNVVISLVQYSGAASISFSMYVCLSSTYSPNQVAPYVMMVDT